MGGVDFTGIYMLCNFKDRPTASRPIKMCEIDPSHAATSCENMALHRDIGENTNVFNNLCGP